MWIVSGPTVMPLECGEGMEARTAGTREAFCPAAQRRVREADQCRGFRGNREVPPGPECPRLEEDLESYVVRAAGANQADRLVQVDVESCAQLDSVAGPEAGPLELLSTPELDALPLRLPCNDRLCRSHPIEPFVAIFLSVFGQNAVEDVPIPGDPNI